ncbi:MULTISPECIES: creatininase [unclassified Clostridium]|uniref:creatininase n=1 Tax=unclassified Clostridium TaxID=2614128 RepID=UPI0025BA1561|nr:MULTISPECIES: creatininase [unclassified Clostridium]
MEIKLDALTWQEFNERKEKDVVILPIGSLEQHGPHLPLCTDTVISYELSLLLAKEINGIVAPSINYGYKSLPASGGGPLFPGTIDLNGSTVVALVKDILEEFIKDGVKKILIFNSHYENEAFILEAADLVSRNIPKGTKIIITNWWDPLSNETIDKIFDEIPFPGWALEHAAITETSFMLKFTPELVHMERLVDETMTPLGYSIYPVPSDLVPPSGLLASARSSSKEKADMMIEEIISKIKSIIEKIF